MDDKIKEFCVDEAREKIIMITLYGKVFLLDINNEMTVQKTAVPMSKKDGQIEKLTCIGYSNADGLIAVASYTKSSQEIFHNEVLYVFKVHDSKHSIELISKFEYENIHPSRTPSPLHPRLQPGYQALLFD